ncbi:hypothetical protein DPMN_057136 [Dreissena polymorpha]|uniref:Uncharacterized protein n=1 Tax=Dreissena polymorpha TaxID=45954 RepID=A0A9D4CSZ5_DREPO|nr:hypothetical protein DPMN_057136 [Dreissena polymorpha]
MIVQYDLWRVQYDNCIAKYDFGQNCKLPQKTLRGPLLLSYTYEVIKARTFIWIEKKNTRPVAGLQPNTSRSAGKYSTTASWRTSC